MARRTLITAIGLTAIVFALVACSSGPREIVDYKKASVRPELEVPPGLDELPAGSENAAGATTYSGFSAEQSTKDASTGQVLPRFAKVKLQHGYGEYWLLVDARPDDVWHRVRGFVFGLGLTIAKENKTTGMIETNWAENRAKLSHGLVSGLFSVFETTDTRDRYRFNLQRGTRPGTTEVHLLHQQLRQVTAASDSEGSYERVWEPVPPDPQIEAEVLRLLMVRMGVGEAASRSMIASSGISRPRAVAEEHGLVLREPPAHAWIRVGLTLERTAGVSIADRDQAKGVYSIRVSDPNEKNKKPGFFGRLFGEKAGPKVYQYQVALAPRGDGDTTALALQDKKGRSVTTDAGKAFLKELLEQLR
jgi:outer membrane protein assembly factor BamC